MTLLRRIDHVYVVLNDAEEAHRFLQEEVGLPVAWPFQNYGDFASGAIGLGNMNLELVSSAEDFPALHPARLVGIAFTPTADNAATFLDGLAMRGIEHSGVRPSPGWTSVSLAGEGWSDFAAFVCFYDSVDLFESDLASLRERAIEDAGGGRLGVRRVTGVVVGTADLAAAERRWRRFLAPASPDSELRWRFESGPSLRLVAHDRDEILDLILGVESGDAQARWAELSADDPLDGLPISFRVVEA